MIRAIRSAFDRFADGCESCVFRAEGPLVPLGRRFPVAMTMFVALAILAKVAFFVWLVLTPVLSGQVVWRAAAHCRCEPLATSGGRP